METVKLSKPLTVKGKDLTEVTFNFESLTGNDLMTAERETRAMGDQTPSVFASMRFQAILAGKMVGVPADDILALPAADFKNVIYVVASFLLS